MHCLLIDVINTPAGSSSPSTCNGTNKSQTLNDPRSSTLSSGGATSNGSAKISGSIVVEVKYK